MIKIFHWLWLPQKDYSRVFYLVFSPIFFAMSLLLPSFVNVKYIGMIAECVFISPLIIAAIITIRHAQICSISQGVRSKHSKVNMKTKKRVGIIGIFGATVSLAVVNLFSNNFFYVLIGILSIFSGYFLFLASIYSKKFLIIGILYLVLYFLFAIFYIDFLPIVLIFFFAILLLPNCIAEVILFKRIQIENPRQK